MLTAEFECAQIKIMESVYPNINSKTTGIPITSVSRFRAFGALTASGAALALANRTRHYTTLTPHTAEEIMKTQERLKSLPIKFGQLSNYADPWIAEDYGTMFTARQRWAQPIANECIQGFISRDVGIQREEPFSGRAQTPAAVTSIGQIYQVRLRDDTMMASFKSPPPSSSRHLAEDIPQAKLKCPSVHTCGGTPVYGAA